MKLFKRKKVEMPKTPLGVALYKYDIMVNKDLKNILNGIETGKKLNKKKAGVIVENASEKFDSILDELSKEKLKVDYWSDKIRYDIIDMINKLKNLLNRAKADGFCLSETWVSKNCSEIDEIEEIRNSIRSKMKDIESDYL